MQEKEEGATLSSVWISFARYYNSYRRAGPSQRLRSAFTFSITIGSTELSSLQRPEPDFT
jgi:hypothetical protein